MDHNDSEKIQGRSCVGNEKTTYIGIKIHLQKPIDFRKVDNPVVTVQELYSSCRSSSEVRQ